MAPGAERTIAYWVPATTAAPGENAAETDAEVIGVVATGIVALASDVFVGEPPETVRISTVSPTAITHGVML